jgi:hypothetical protein
MYFADVLCLQKHPGAWVFGYLLMMVAGCAMFRQEEVIHLTEAKRLHATQAHVKRRLGVPKFAHFLSRGDLEISNLDEHTDGDLNGPGTSYCDQYAAFRSEGDFA